MGLESVKGKRLEACLYLAFGGWGLGCGIPFMESEKCQNSWSEYFKDGN